jgi:hypothetical protein
LDGAGNLRQWQPLHSTLVNHGTGLNQTMPRKPKSEDRPKAIAEHLTYAAWKTRAAALLERQATAVMRERDWRQLYIRSKAPEDAARQAETLYWNTRSPLERTRKR